MNLTAVERIMETKSQLSVTTTSGSARVQIVILIFKTCSIVHTWQFFCTLQPILTGCKSSGAMWDESLGIVPVVQSVAVDGAGVL